MIDTIIAFVCGAWFGAVVAIFTLAVLGKNK